MKRLVLVWMLICLLAPALTGCALKDLDKRFFITVIGVDATEDPMRPYRVTLKLAIPSPTVIPGKENYQVLSQDAPTITEAVRLLKSKVDKEFDFGHATVLVFGKKLAERNIRMPLDWFLRRRDIQMIAYVGVGDPTAESVVEMAPKSERLAGNALVLSFGQSGTESSYIVTEYLFDFYRRLTELGLDPYMPVIQPLPDQKTYNINKVALFDKSKLVQVLNPDETRKFNELAREFDKFDARVSSDGVNYSLAVENFHDRYKILTPPGQRPYIDYHVRFGGTAEESVKPIDDSEWKKYEKVTEQAFAERYVKLLEKIRDLRVDPFGFGLRYRATHYQQTNWKDWQEIYPNLDFRVKVNVKFEGTGEIR